MAKRNLPPTTIIDDDDFPPNSRESKLQVNDLEQDLESGEKVIAKARIKKQKRKRNTFFSFLYKEGKKIALYLWEDVIIPGIKDTIQNGLENGIDMVFNGSDDEYRGSTRRRSSGPRVISYNQYFKSDNDRRRRKTRREKVHSKLDGVTFEFAPEAKNVLKHLQELQEEYGTVSIADFLEAAGLPENIDSADSINGWGNSIQNANVRRTEDNDYIIVLPRPISI